MFSHVMVGSNDLEALAQILRRPVRRDRRQAGPGG